MNKFYVILPFILLVLFVGYYSVDSKRLSEIDAARARQVASEQKAADAQKAEAEARATADAQAREQQRLKDIRDKEEAHERDVATKLAAIKADFTVNSDKADALAKQAGDLQIQLADLQTAKEKDSEETFNLTKQTDLLRIQQQNAEFEIQRLTDMVAQRADQSWMAQPPPPPPAKN